MIHALINRIYRAGRGEDSDYYKRSPPPSISITETHRSPLHKSPNSRLPLHRLVVRNHSPDSREYRERGYKRNALRRNFHTFIQRLQWYSRIRLLRWIVGAILFAFLLFWSRWETHIEIMFYSRSWIKNEIKKLEPLAGCFEKHRISSQYNLTLARGPKTHEIQAGLPLRFGMDCYDFAGTITTPAPTAHQTGRQIFHSYWRSDLVQFGERQAWMLKSFFATQDLSKSTLILWSNGDLTRNQYVSSYLRMYPNSFQTTIVDVTHLARQTALSGSPLLAQKDSRAWVDGDLVRLLVTWEYGGVWIDMDSLLTRDLSPLLDHEFVTQWDCYGKSLLLISRDTVRVCQGYTY
ncbi:hypothetical protein FRC02_000281 [Tulasnella sp. 418]|nr:hypothetical protein FRC02_000281 [Tulasnella sp. 418]